MASLVFYQRNLRKWFSCSLLAGVKKIFEAIILYTLAFPIWNNHVLSMRTYCYDCLGAAYLGTPGSLHICAVLQNRLQAFASDIGNADAGVPASILNSATPCNEQCARLVDDGPAEAASANHKTRRKEGAAIAVDTSVLIIDDSLNCVRPIQAWEAALENLRTATSLESRIKTASDEDDEAIVEALEKHTSRGFEQSDTCIQAINKYRYAKHDRRQCRQHKSIDYALPSCLSCKNHEARLGENRGYLVAVGCCGLALVVVGCWWLLCCCLLLLVAAGSCWLPVAAVCRCLLLLWVVAGCWGLLLVVGGLLWVDVGSVGCCWFCSWVLLVLLVVVGCRWLRWRAEWGSGGGGVGSGAGEGEVEVGCRRRGCVGWLAGVGCREGQGCLCQRGELHQFIVMTPRSLKPRSLRPRSLTPRSPNPDASCIHNEEM